MNQNIYIYTCIVKCIHLINITHLLLMNVKMDVDREFG